MIAFHASAVCRVRDGYTGRPLEGASLLCALDGAPVRPLVKPGGYLILLNLSQGPHRLALRCHGYQEEWVDFPVEGGTLELEITMKPGPGYPFREEVVRAELTVTENGAPVSGRQLWLAAPARWELKIAQTRAEAGAQQFRLYCKGAEAAVPPGPYLIADGADSEIVHLRSLAEETAALAEPLRRPHGRSRILLPAQRYHTDRFGHLSAVFESPCTLEICGEAGGLLASLPLERGVNRLDIRI